MMNTPLLTRSRSPLPSYPSPRKSLRWTAALLAIAMLTFGPAHPLAASSHREAPFVTESPKVDATDFYMFRSYEPGRQNFVTLVANYLPLQDPYGGPNYFNLDPEAIYEIHVDNNGDATEDITFQFRFKTTNRNLTLPIGPPGAEKNIAVPLVNVGPITATDNSNQNVVESYTLDVVMGDRRTGTSQPILDTNGVREFPKPVDNIGTKSIPDYNSYAAAHRYDIALPGSTQPGRLFVGQRKDSFVVNLGEVFDLVNFDPIGPEDGRGDDLADKNVTSLCLELPISFLTNGSEPVLGAWTSASLRQARILNPRPDFSNAKDASVEGGAFTQVSRLGSPLVNELLIGLGDKDRFNASEPKDDVQFRDYVTNPVLPSLLESLFSVPAPTLFPRDDLVAAFLTGFDGLNKPSGATTGEMLRLNTDFDPTPAFAQNRLGFLDGDPAGYPNGRRPGDDVVDIELRVAMGVLLSDTDAPAGQLPFTDGAVVDASFFDEEFPYLRDPLPGSPQN